MTARRPLLIDAGAFINAIDEAMNKEPKMTPWFPCGTKPARVGEYNASTKRDKHARRWWNGRRWSIAYYPGSSDDAKARARREAAPLAGTIAWRGLAHPPT